MSVELLTGQSVVNVVHMDTNATRMLAAISTQIKVELVDKGMEQKRLAEMVGIEPATLSRYMKGHRPMPMPVFFDVAEALGLTPRELMSRAQDRLDREG